MRCQPKREEGEKWNIKHFSVTTQKCTFAGATKMNKATNPFFFALFFKMSFIPAPRYVWQLTSSMTRQRARELKTGKTKDEMFLVPFIFFLQSPITARIITKAFKCKWNGSICPRAGRIEYLKCILMCEFFWMQFGMRVLGFTILQTVC